MDFGKIFGKFFGTGHRLDILAEKQALLAAEALRTNEKDRRTGLVFNSGKNPLQEKIEEVNYRRSRPAPLQPEKKVEPVQDLLVRKEIKSKKPPENSGNRIEKEVERSLAEKLHLGEAWRAPKIIKTNLVKGEITTFINWQKNLNNLSVAVGISASIIAAIYVGLVIMSLNVENQGRVLEGEVDMLKVQIVKAQDELREIDKFQEKLKYAKALLDNHVYWTNFFEFLEKNLLPNTSLEGAFSGQPDGVYSFSLVTADFGSMTDQLTLLRSKPEVVSVVSDGGKREVIVSEKLIEGEEKAVKSERSQVSYKIDIVLDPKLFKKPSQ